MPLTIGRRDLPEGVAVLAVAGELDKDSLAQLREAVAAAFTDGLVRVVLDLDNLGFCDSSGLSLFVDLHRSARRREGWLRLAAVPEFLSAMVEATNLDRLFVLYETVDAAAAGTDRGGERRGP